MDYSISSIMDTFHLANKRGLINSDLIKTIGQELKDNGKDYDYFSEIRELNKKKKQAKKEKNEYEVEDINTEINKLQSNLDNKVLEYFENCLHKIETDSNFNIKIESRELSGKVIYTLEKRLDILVLMMLLNEDLRRCYKVYPTDRMAILRPLKYLLQDKQRNIILRLDIKSFFESISFDTLLNKFEDDQLLYNESLFLLNKINDSYRSVSENNTGIPRGIGCSPYLAEIFMKDIDNKIKEFEGVFFYQRYVDDIIILAHSNDDKYPGQLFEYVKEIMQEHGLDIHDPDEKDKTRIIDTRKDSISFDYLGYHIEKNGCNVEYTISDNKISLYEERISSAVSRFLTNIKQNKRKTLRYLLLELRMLTSNYNLVGNKSGIMSGIFYKYPLLTNTSQLEYLDTYLKSEINKITAEKIPEHIGDFGHIKFTKEECAKYIRRRCLKYSFVTGYKHLKRSRISSEDFKIYKHRLRYENKTDKDK